MTYFNILSDKHLFPPKVVFKKKNLDYLKVVYKYCTDSVRLFCATCSVKNLDILYYWYRPV